MNRPGPTRSRGRWVAKASDRRGKTSVLAGASEQDTTAAANRTTAPHLGEPVGARGGQRRAPTKRAVTPVQERQTPQLCQAGDGTRSAGVAHFSTTVSASGEGGLVPLSRNR